MYSTLRKNLEDMKACNIADFEVAHETADDILLNVIQTLTQGTGDRDLENIAIAICIEYQKLKKQFA